LPERNRGAAGAGLAEKRLAEGSISCAMINLLELLKNCTRDG
jgi:hypothetical protein